MTQAGTGYFGAQHEYLMPQDTYYTRRVSGPLGEAVPVSPEAEILELGCGAGRFSLPLLERGLRLTCVDNASELLAVFRRHIKAGHRVDILEADFFGLSGQYDAMIGFFVPHYFTDHRRLFGQCRALLRSGGRIGFVEPNLFNPLYYLAPFFYRGLSWRDEHYDMVVRPRRLRHLRNAGFQHIRIEKCGFLPPQMWNRRFGPAMERWIAGWVPRLWQVIVASVGS